MPSHGDRVAAGLALAGVALMIIQELVNLFDSPSSSSDAEVPRETDSAKIRVEGEMADMRKKVVALHADGLRQAKSGDHRSAANNFQRAALIAEQIGESGPYWRDYWANRSLMNLKEALALRAEGNLVNAMHYLALARGNATNAGRPDLAARIDSYQAEIRAERQKQTRMSPAERGERYRRECTLFNGTEICQ